MGITKEKG